MTWDRGSLRLLGLPLMAFAVGFLLGRAGIIVSRLAAPEPQTLLQAVEQGYDDAMLRMIQAGEDPGLPVVLGHPVFDWHRGDIVSPLLAAIARGDKEEVALLFKSTNRNTESPNDQALCVVARFGHSSIAQLLFRMGVPAGPESGCGTQKETPEEVAARHGNKSLAAALRNYRETLPRRASRN